MKDNKKILLVMFLLGIFIGALDSGIVSPARTIIANSLSVSQNNSVWVITIYTLAYAVSMPISGKLSDRYGKKKLYTISIFIFGLGSLLCGLSNYFGSFSLLLTSRVIQAIGGGGIMPIATAYIGDSFPIEKKGSALGLVGGIYGIANMLGPTIGSAILSLVGPSNWGVLFFINVPIVIAVVIISLLIKEESVVKTPKKMDIGGSVVASLLILSIMYSLTNMNFHDFTKSITSIQVYPYLILFVVLIPVFIAIEKKAEDPIINLKFFTNREIALTLIIAFTTGAGLMGVVFVPQFCENVLKMKTGSGGYLVTLMAIFTGISAPLGGKLIDKYSAKFILILGFSFTITGSLILALLAVKIPSIFILLAGLALMGLGMGFTMGTPLNYLVQTNVSENETASAQSTLSLIRSIGVAISPNILVNFISDAAKNLEGNLMAVMPKISMGPNAPAQSLGGNSVSPNAIAGLQNADVTTIVDSLKKFSSSIIDNVAPNIKQSMAGKLPHGVSPDAAVANLKANYLSQIESSRKVLETTFQNTINSGFTKLFICAAVIALVGLILSIALKNKTKLQS
ncbi:MFS transporter [Clostridium sp. JN-9]|uniref:MFS transporter n=1 Tax=Clostridium sp. JN-9 TaxID=2507159 RepID=UPI000FFE0B89|nr:MFS transporter [Clostridium sp. JN-9]QAT39188.1 MFS transporter [Clostridium sp. JN-9]